MNNRPNKDIPDREIIELILEENRPELFEILFKRYHSKVRDKVFSFLKDREKADEFTNDIFSKVFEKLGGFKGNATFSSWLFSVTYNHCIDYLRIQKKLHYPEWNRENIIPEIIDESEEVFFDASYENLLKILELIHPEEKAMLLMKYQDGLTLKEIAATLRVSEDALKMRLKRARTRVIYLYRKHFPD